MWVRHNTTRHCTTNDTNTTTTTNQMKSFFLFLLLITCIVDSIDSKADALKVSFKKLLFKGERRDYGISRVTGGKGESPSIGSNLPPLPTPEFTKQTLADFKSRTAIKAFNRKVYNFFTAQMILTIISSYIVMSRPDLASWCLTIHGKSLGVFAVVVSGIIVTALQFIKVLRLTKPFNFILVGIHLVLQAALTGVFSAHVNTKSVCLGTVHTLTAFLAVTLYTFQPNEAFDLTSLGTFLYTSVFCLTSGVLLDRKLAFTPFDNIFSGIMAVCFATYVANDTKRIVGRKSSSRNYAQNEYLLAALTAFNDLVIVASGVGLKLLTQMRRAGLLRI